MTEDKNLKRLTLKLKKQFGNHLKKIILFGSRARGDYTPESDYDFIFLFDKVSLKDKQIIDNICAEMLLDYGAVITDFTLSEQDLEEMKYEPLIMNVRKEGVLL